MTPKTAAKKSGKPGKAGLPYFTFRRMADGSVLLSNGELAAKGFVREMTDFENYAAACSKKNAFLNSGPGLHILVMTLRCNHKCLYCQSSALGAAGGRTDMSRAVARRMIEQKSGKIINIISDNTYFRKSSGISSYKRNP